MKQTALIATLLGLTACEAPPQNEMLLYVSHPLCLFWCDTKIINDASEVQASQSSTKDVN